MRNLIKNESIKLYRQTGYKVLAIIILVIAILLPVGQFALNLFMDWASGIYSPEEQYEEYLEIAEDYGERYQEEGDLDFLMWQTDYLADAETIKFFLDHDLAEDWKYRMFYGDLYTDLLTQAYYGLLAEEQVSYDELDDGGYAYLIQSDLQESLTGEDPETSDDSEVFPEIDYTRVSWRAEYNRKQTEVQESKDYILECTSRVILEDILESARNGLAEVEAERDNKKAVMEAAKRSYESGVGTLYDYEYAQYQYEIAEADIRCEEVYLWGCQLLYDQACEPDSWQYGLVTTALWSNASTYYRSCVVMTETVWRNMDGPDDDYGAYRESVAEEADNSVEHDLLLATTYALEHDVAPSALLENSPKSTFRDFFGVIMGLISIFMIVMMGMIVANEYSSGTIRLLVIRPKKRHKILTSKILAAILYALILMVACGTILLALTVLFNGFGDLFVSDLYVVGDWVVALPSVISMAIEFVLIFLGVLLRASIALFFSAVTKKAAIAIVIPMILNTYAWVAQLAGLAMAEVLPFINYTILPYLSPEILMTGPFEWLSGSLYGSMYGMICNLNTVYGVFLVLLHIFVIGLGTYLIFNRQQIKN